MKIQEEVREKTKRKMSKLVSLGDERATLKKIQRTDKREESVEWANELDDTKVLMKPKAAVVQEYKLKMEAKQQANEEENIS
jgi:hypothetical protein